MKEYIAIFFTHSGAIKFSRFCKKNHIICELMPVPRKLSSNCGICAKLSYNDNLENITCEEIEKIYQVSDKNYILSYEE